MSTRCQLLVEQNENIKIYQHGDGYPDHILPLLGTILAKFRKDRGYFDPEYLPAQISYYLIKDSKDQLGDSYCKSHGLCPDFHGDIEYKYLIDKDFNIHIENVYYKDKSFKCNIEEAINYKGE